MVRTFALGSAMAEVESGSDDVDVMAMLRGWNMARVDGSFGKYT